MDYTFSDYIFIALFIWVTVTSVAATIVAVVDILRGHFYDPREKRKWLYVVLATGIVGAAVYYFVGRKNRFPPSHTRFPRTQRNPDISR